MLDIHYVEYDATHKENFVHDIPNGHDAWLLLLTHSPAVFWVKGSYVKYPPNCIVLFEPKQKIYYRACSDSYSNDWIRMQTDEVYVLDAPIELGVPFPVNEGVFFHKLFQLITFEHERGGEMKHIIIDKLLQTFFYKISEAAVNKPAKVFGKTLQDLRSEIYLHANQDWSVKMMAERLNISAGHLEGIYKEAFGVSCMEDVILSRIMLAKKYLLGSNYTIAQVAALCGYRNVEHFHRQFKKFAGETPRDFRTKSGTKDRPVLEG